MIIVGGIFYIIEKVKIENIIIGKQFENSENYVRLSEIAREKRIKIIALEEGQKLEIEENLYFEILWPSSNNFIQENAINNNSLVGKLIYKKFSILFTGDIEAMAEKAIIKKYEANLESLKSTILKVAHHGSNTSSIKEFLKIVNPKIALIGVGKNNIFGHPSEITLKSLRNINCKIYRTDNSGEIIIRTNGKKINIKKLINIIEN